MTEKDQINLALKGAREKAREAVAAAQEAIRQGKRNTREAREETATSMIVVGAATVGGVLVYDKVYSELENRWPFLKGKRYMSKLAIGGVLLLLFFMTKNPLWLLSAVVELGLINYDKLQGFLGLASGVSVEGVYSETQQQPIVDVTAYDMEALAEALAGLDDSAIAGISDEIELGIIDPVTLSTLITLAIKGGKLAAPAVKAAVEHLKERRQREEKEGRFRQRYQRPNAKDKLTTMAAKEKAKPVSKALPEPAAPALDINDLMLALRNNPEAAALADAHPAAAAVLAEFVQGKLQTPEQVGAAIDRHQRRTGRREDGKAAAAEALSKALADRAASKTSTTPTPAASTTPTQTFDG